MSQKGGKIKIAIIGVGNCASSLIQGIEFYRSGNLDNKTEHIGLMHYDLGGYKPEDIEIVAAFDIDKRKVGKTVGEAVFSKPNCTQIFCEDLSAQKCPVFMGNLLDGVSDHMKDYSPDRTFIVANENASNIEKVLKDSGAEIMLIYSTACRFSSSAKKSGAISLRKKVFLASATISKRRLVQRLCIAH